LYVHVFIAIGIFTEQLNSFRESDLLINRFIFVSIMVLLFYPLPMGGESIA